MVCRETSLTVVLAPREHVVPTVVRGKWGTEMVVVDSDTCNVNSLFLLHDGSLCADAASVLFAYGMLPKF